MNLLTYSHSAGTLLRTAFRLYQHHFIPMMALALVLLIPSLLIMTLRGLQGNDSLFQTEQLVITLMMGVLESAMALGILSLAAGSIFPTSGLIRILRSRMILGAIHIAILLYLMRFLGLTGIMLPFPMNFLLVAFWILSHFFFALAQPVYAIEGERGMRALIRSFRLVRQNLPRVFGITVFSYSLQIGVLFLLLQLFLPDFDSSMDELSTLEQLFNAPELTNSISLAQHLTALIFYPFAALLSVLLYFDIAHRESGFQTAPLEHMALSLFGITPKQPAAPQTEEFSQPEDEPVEVSEEPERISPMAQDEPRPEGDFLAEEPKPVAEKPDEPEGIHLAPRSEPKPEESPEPKPEESPRPEDSEEASRKPDPEKP
jgi:hypothetical protein